MLNPLAEQLIHDLRYDSHTRQHFSIMNWSGKNTCRTVGCIAGTAILRSFGEDEIVWYGCEFRLQDPTRTYVDAGAELLNLDTESARQIFMPWQWMEGLLFERMSSPFEHLSHNERPALETVEQMKRWALEHQDGPHHKVFDADTSARVLELKLAEEIPYVDWMTAHQTKHKHRAEA